MTTELLKKLGTVTADNLVAGTDPALRVGSGLLRKNTGDLKRGTVLAKSSRITRWSFWEQKRQARKSLNPMVFLLMIFPFPLMKTFT